MRGADRRDSRFGAGERRGPGGGVVLGGAAAAVVAASVARAGGTPEYALLVIDPTDPVSMRVGNYYREARNIPESNVLYVRSAAASYQQFCATNVPAVLGTLEQRGTTGQVAYIVVAPMEPFYVPASGLVSDLCSPVTRFSVPSAYTTAFIRSEVLAGTSVTLPNQYYNLLDPVYPFEGNQGWLSGQPSGAANARRYFIGAMLGYTGDNGNTVAEIESMIARSVAVDGTRPAGTFYFMNNPSDPARNVRQPAFASAITGLATYSGTGVELTGVLPTGQTDCLGIMAGAETVPFAGSGVVIRPGAFCDHLTSWAGTFDIGLQTKVSAWIANGASGSAGAVEEPCNYTGKFPHPRMHMMYFQGLSLGEAFLRSMAYVPFQEVLYGDPLTRPFARFPTVNVPGAPTGPVSGVITLVPVAAATAPGAGIAGLDLYIDGVKRQTVGPGGQFTFSTAALSDGVHDVRVLARDTTSARNVGRWIGALTTNNFGRAVTISPSATSGDLGTAFDFTVAATGGAGVEQVRLMQHGRVVAALNGAGGVLRVYGQNLGAGVSALHAEATYVGGRTARSGRVQVTVAPGGSVQDVVPVAYSYDKAMYQRNAYVVEMPYASDVPPQQITWTLLTSPAQATVAAGTTGPYRIITPNANASGSETVTFRVQTPGHTSNTATIRLVYTAPVVCPPDWDGNGLVEPADVAAFVSAWSSSVQQGTLLADFDGNGRVDPADVAAFVNTWFAALLNGCP